MKRAMFCVLVVLVIGIISSRVLMAAPQEALDSQNSETAKSGESGKCSISGRCTDSVGSGIPNVKIHIYGTDEDIFTDGSGMYSFKNLEPREYTLKFFPPHPFCCKFFRRHGRQCQKTFILKSGEEIVFEKVFEIGGALSGKVYKSFGRPLKGVTVYASSYNGSSVSTETKEDGSYFIGSLFPSHDYFIEFQHDISGYSYRLLTGIEVEKDLCTEVQDVFFDLNNRTGFEGYVKSSMDGYPLPDVRVTVYYKNNTNAEDITFLCGYIKTDSNGYFRINGIDRPGIYHISATPPIPPPKHPRTGKPLYAMLEAIKFIQSVTVNVKKGEMTKVFVTLDIPSYAPIKNDKKML